MSRAGGQQAKTISKYAFLDKEAEDWKSTDDLAFALSEKYDHSYPYARAIVNQWALIRIGDAAVQKYRAGRTNFYCTITRMKPTPVVLATRYWGELPESFKINRPGLRQHEDWLYLTLLAYGWFIHKRRDCYLGLNRYLKKYGFTPVK